MTSVPAFTQSREDFTRNLSDSGLFTTDELGHLPEGDGATLVHKLTESGRLTNYQVQAIQSRRFSELRIGNYDVLSKLGAGGMGSVYKAKHRKMKRIVALKVLAAEIASQGSFIQRFQREVETIAQLQHPNIVMAFDADECESGHFLVMEFVDGRDLSGDVEKNGPLSVADAVECIRQAAEGLAYAHRRGIVHRDIKPANLLRDVTGLVKVADLGLARLSSAAAENSSITQAGGILGTADYMPPEQALDSTTIDHRADIYSLGCTLYFLLTGRPPFQASSLMGLLLAHRDKPIPSVRDFRADVPPSVEAVIARMLAKKPTDRQASMDEVCQALTSLRAQVQHLTNRPSGATTAKPAAAGTDMTVTLDAATGVAAALISSPPSMATSRRIVDLSLVLVEPSRTQAAIVRKLLESLGIKNVHTANSGQQALQLGREKQVEAFLSAMQLSDMTGVQLAEQARISLPDVGIVVTSSADDAEQATAALQAKNVILLPKPFDGRKLVAALCRATGRLEE